MTNDLHNAASDIDWQEICELLKTWALELGFSDLGTTDLDIARHRAHLQDWLDQGFHGEMAYMERHADLRGAPDNLHPGSRSVISVRMNYLESSQDPMATLKDHSRAYISRYALGRDYHKTIRSRLARLMKRLDDKLQSLGFDDLNARPFTDSAPVLEKGFAEKSGLGWIGKNTLLLNESAGSWFFLGEVLTNLPLPSSGITRQNRCGSCSACMDICPTRAIVAPYQLDARKCISYLTIEYRGSIDESLRRPMGNRVFGCDDCQLVCPWNRYAAANQEDDFKPRNNLDSATLIELFEWTETEFLKNTEGSAIRRTGYSGWLRNLAIGLGNSLPDRRVIKVLEARLGKSELVDEHIRWAIREQEDKLKGQ